MQCSSRQATGGLQTRRRAARRELSSAGTRSGTDILSFQREQTAELSRRKTLACEPVQVAAGRVRDEVASVLAERHLASDELNEAGQAMRSVPGRSRRLGSGLWQEVSQALPVSQAVYVREVSVASQQSSAVLHCTGRDP